MNWTPPVLPDGAWLTTLELARVHGVSKVHVRDKLRAHGVPCRTGERPRDGTIGPMPVREWEPEAAHRVLSIRWGIPPGYVGSREAARIIGCSWTVVRRYLARRGIDGEVVRQRRLWPESEVRRAVSIHVPIGGSRPKPLPPMASIPPGPLTWDEAERIVGRPVNTIRKWHALHRIPSPKGFVLLRDLLTAVRRGRAES